MSVQASQIRAVRELMQSRRGDTVEAVQALMPIRRFDVPRPSATAGAPERALRVIDGGLSTSPAASSSELRLALGDVVLSVSAVDGAIAIEEDGRLLVDTSVRGLMGRRAVSREASPAIWEALEAGEARWLEDPASVGVRLPRRAQSLALPFRTDRGRGLAILSFTHRRRLSAADLRWFTHVLSTAATVEHHAPSIDERPLAA